MPIRFWRGKITYIINIRDIFHLTKTSHCKECGEKEGEMQSLLNEEYEYFSLYVWRLKGKHVTLQGKHK